jgi:hypothetical protein
MERKRLLGRLWFLIAFVSLSGAGWATPQLGVSGRLLDAKGEPIHYYEGANEGRHEVRVNLAAELVFYDSETTQTSMYTISSPTITAEAFDGYFSIHFTLPGSVLLKDHIYYTLAIDADRNGLTDADLFAGRFQIGAVPFALSAQPSHSFTTHGGRVNLGSTLGIYSKVMQVVPFETPPGGVEFNVMNIFVGGTGMNSSFAFGIYDAQGKIIANSGRIDIKDVSIHNAFLEVELPKTIKLEPSKIYYTGLARSNDNPYFPGGLQPSRPIYGLAEIPTSDGSIANSFDPNTIDINPDVVPLPIALTLVPSPPHPALQGKDPTKPQVRWIYTKLSKVVKARSKATGN